MCLYKSSILILMVSSIIISVGCSRDMDRNMLRTQLHDLDTVVNLFPQSADQITQETNSYISEIKKQFEKILAIPAENRTFQNTALAFDDMLSLSDSAIKMGPIEAMAYVHPDDAVRKAAHDSAQKLREFSIDIVNDKRLYQAFKEYVEGNAKSENLSPEQRYYLDESMRDFKRAGLHLPDEQLNEIKALKKQLVSLTQQFEKNIDEDKSSIIVAPEALQGLEESFIATLKKDDAGNYILGVDYPTYFQVMQHCSVEDTRKRLYEAFNMRAYPANDALLKQVIAVRDQLAKKLGYESYAQYDLESQMVKSPEKAEQFLDDLIDRAQEKDAQEFAQLTQELPESVTLTQDGKIKTWDLSFVNAAYKKKHFNIDERKIAEYFPMEKTIQGLLDVYRAFLNVEFEQVPVSGVWHEDVQLIKVYNKDKTELLGHLFMDLHPRPNKYSHGAHVTLVPSVRRDDLRVPGASMLMTNFPAATHDKPALFMRSDVKTFFHEFGHALHALLGATYMASASGTSVKRDFVELPSQMLEEWLYDKDILKMVSGHYQTGEPLPDELIDTIIALKQFGAGYFVRSQGVLSKMSLDCHKAGECKDPYHLQSELYRTILTHVHRGENDRQYASFGHLTNYNAKYYGYLWSRVFALDLFEMIKEHGLLNPEIGTKYVREVLERGGSADPNELLKNFLGREPKIDAFLKDMGL